jgi:WD40 repeat protein
MHHVTMTQGPIFRRLRFTLMLGALVSSWSPPVKADIEYFKVDSLFQKHCLDCHSGKDAEGQLILDSYDLLMKGGESGPVVRAGKSGESILVKSVEGTFEKDGKRQIMPPGSKRKKLEAAEIALLKAWIDAGAKGPTGQHKPLELVVPKVPVKGTPRQPVNAIAFAPNLKQAAIARYGAVELRTVSAPTESRWLEGHRGNVNAVLFSPDARTLFAAGGDAGVAGEVRQWSVADGTLVRVLEGHTDAIYAAALSPDGKTLATGSYDQSIKLWNAETGAALRTLTGHNGAVFGLAFRPDGKILASASADRTVKLWNVESGKRTDTLSQPLKEQYAVAFTADGRQLFAAGADSRIRLWQISDAAAETTNPILSSHFAHEGTILRLVFAPDGNTLLSCAEDKTVKLWNPRTMEQLQVFDKQPDWVSAAAFVSGRRIAIGRLDGSFELYDVAVESATAPPALKAKAN